MIGRTTMARWIVLLLLVHGFATAVHAESSTYFGFSIGVSNAPPPPRIVVADAPPLVAVPGTSVQVVGIAAHDIFAYGSTFYCYANGFWYRSGSYGGPYAVVDVRSVPQPILVVPAKHWKHHPLGGPPGQRKKR